MRSTPRPRSSRAAGTSSNAASTSRATRRRVADEQAARAAAGLAAAEAHLHSVDARLREDEERPIARAARRRGGRRLDDELVVDPGLRDAVEAALEELARAYVIDAAAA